MSSRSLTAERVVPTPCYGHGVDADSHAGSGKSSLVFGTIAPSRGGARLNPTALSSRIDGRNIAEGVPLYCWFGLTRRIVLAVWYPCLIILALRLLRITRATEALLSAGRSLALASAAVRACRSSCAAREGWRIRVLLSGMALRL
jgi:hypothetical protein